MYWNPSGKKPTSEWEIYWDIFKKRKEINAVLHGHDLFALETAYDLVKEYPEEVAITKRVTDAGSIEYREDMQEIVSDKNIYLIGKEHGFFALGKNFFKQTGVIKGKLK